MPIGNPSSINFKYDGFKLLCEFQFNELTDKLVRVFNEGVFTKLMYTDQSLYDKIGKSFCICYDIALAKSGTEAVVESLYSVMKTQVMSGVQSNSNTVNRTKVDWFLPKTPLGIESFIKDVVAVYTKKKNFPYTTSMKPSKVMERLKEDMGKLPPSTC